MIWDGDIAKEASRLRWLESDRQRKREETRAMLQGGLIGLFIVLPLMILADLDRKKGHEQKCAETYGWVWEKMQ